MSREEWMLMAEGAWLLSVIEAMICICYFAFKDKSRTHNDHSREIITMICLFAFLSVAIPLIILALVIENGVLLNIVPMVLLILSMGAIGSAVAVGVAAGYVYNFWRRINAPKISKSFPAALIGIIIMFVSIDALAMEQKNAEELLVDNARLRIKVIECDIASMDTVIFYQEELLSMLEEIDKSKKLGAELKTTVENGKKEMEKNIRDVQALKNEKLKLLKQEKQYLKRILSKKSSI